MIEKFAIPIGLIILVILWYALASWLTSFRTKKQKKDDAETREAYFRAYPEMAERHEEATKWWSEEAKRIERELKKMGKEVGK